MDEAAGAAVRIAMTVGVAGESGGRLVEVVAETETGEDAANVTLTERTGLLHANLTVGANLTTITPLAANEGLVSRGVQTIGDGFVVSREQAERWIASDNRNARFLRVFLNGKDLTATPRKVRVIDAFGFSQDDLLAQAPALYQHLLVTVKPLRDQSRRDSYRKNWWILGEPQPALRRMIAGLPRYIASPVTAKHRFFVFLDAVVLADQALNVFALDDAYFLGVLSSRIHVVWALATGGTLEDRPRYNNSRCFNPFPFPTATEAQQTHIRALAERLDAHRKRQQAQHPKLTLTDMYNVLEKLRAPAPAVRSSAFTRPGPPEGGTPNPAAAHAPGAPLALTAKERVIHEHGLVSVLRQLHDDLDATVAGAYGWPEVVAGVNDPGHSAASDEAILTRLCALNAQRAAEERTGTIRHLRPAFQRMKDEGGRMKAAQAELGIPDAAPLHPSSLLLHPSAKWPKTFTEQALAVRTALTAFAASADAETLAKTFKGAQADRIEDLLETLASLGQARRLVDGRFVSA